MSTYGSENNSAIPSRRAYRQAQQAQDHTQKRQFGGPSERSELSTSTTEFPTRSRAARRQSGEVLGTPVHATENRELPAESSWTRSIRGSLLVALAAATVIVPVSGMVTPGGSQANAAPVSTPAWADTIESKIDAAEATALRSKPAAAARAAVREQLQDNERCLKVAASANGTRTALVKPDATEAKDDFLFWPLSRGTYRIASGYGMRVNPVLGIYRLHAGVDMAGAAGTPIHSVADGVVKRVSWDSGLGYSAEIYHPSRNITTVYGHMISGSSNLRVGQEVSAGDQVGLLGSTGNSTGPHLHFEVHRGNDADNHSATEPMSWMKSSKAIFLDEREAMKQC
ncbi:hypothetical protein BSR29_06490 [Boudabousia liubingyangii]|uniref:M23ase beta-sheet core domain-containing protein n=1 Tax=Boudabousia liubingyangii TaxID=1921764 RepID=A0A1Q5PKV5_9ACTO|nr:M23 family metallopeptidase [Boudabousia liubingyangii]OKL46416.1 hypothetical protein BSR28_07790 [Boudabousia liubingyangii]OKL47262.1 hypothetical protein BSR29_06490 [Boudabousia liubingyangii]